MARATERAPPRPRTGRRIWDWTVKYGPAIVVVIGGFWEAGKWTVERSDAFVAEQERQKQADKLALRESQKPFLEKQLAFYLEASLVTAELGTLPFPKTLDEAADAVALPEPGSQVRSWAAARQRFWELHWGEMAVVESPAVRDAMVAVGRELHGLEACLKVGGDCGVFRSRLNGASIDLSHKIRDSITAGWGYDLPPATTEPAATPGVSKRRDE